MDGKQAWETVIAHVMADNVVTTVTGLSFTVTFVGSCIFLKGGTPGTKRAEKGEYLTAKDFISAYDSVKEDSRHRSSHFYIAPAFWNKLQIDYFCMNRPAGESTSRIPATATI